MKLFQSIKKKLFSSSEEKRWNRMWDAWAKGDMRSPCAELMTYESEVGNGGHGQYFFNLANSGDLKSQVETVLRLLPEPLRENLKRGYEAFAAQENIDDDVNDDLFDACDSVFYEHEQLLIDVLKACAGAR